MEEEEPVFIEGPLAVLAQVVLGREEAFAARIGGMVAAPGFVRWTAEQVDLVAQEDLLRLYYVVAALPDEPNLPTEINADWPALVRLWRRWLPVQPLQTRLAVRVRRLGQAWRALASRKLEGAAAAAVLDGLGRGYRLELNRPDHVLWLVLAPGVAALVVDLGVPVFGPARKAEGAARGAGQRSSGPAPPRARLQKAETVLAGRSTRIAVVLERVYDSHNQQAILRTCDNLGVQHLYIIVPVEAKKKAFVRTVTRGAEAWLTVRHFASTAECIAALRADGREIWATDLSFEAVNLEGPGLTLPARLALVMGRESEGISEEMLAAAHKRVYLPIWGFSESLNVSVATALILQRLFFICPGKQVPNQQKLVGIWKKQRRGF